MNLLKGLFVKKNESVKDLREGFKIKESEDSKIYNDVNEIDLNVAELIDKFEKVNHIIVLEIFSKQEKKVIGRRKMLNFEVPYKVWTQYNVKDEIKIRFYFASKEEMNMPSSKMPNITKNKQKPQSLFNVDELVIEREGLVKFHHDYNKNTKDVKLFITKDIILFHPVKEKLRVTQIPLVYIDSVTKHESESNTFVVSTTGVDYFFCCKNEEAVGIWIKDLIYFIRYAQEKFLVQQAEIKMKESNVNVINSLMGLCDLSENEIFNKKKLRDSLFRMLEKKQKEDSNASLHSKKRYIEAFEKDDRINMEEILSTMSKQDLLHREDSSENELSQRISEFRRESRFDRELGEFDHSGQSIIRPSGFFNVEDGSNEITIKNQIYYKKYYDKFRQELREMFEIDEFVAYLLDEIYIGTSQRSLD
jgi:hypothetical protein